MTVDPGAASAEGEVLALYDEHAPALMRFVLAATGDEELARDAVQEAFLQLLDARRAGRAPGNIREGLFRSVRESIARCAGEAESNAAPLGAAARVAAPESADAETPETLPLALIRLASPREREILHLRAEGLSYSAIGGILGISTGTVGSMLARVMRKLRAAERRRLRR